MYLLFLPFALIWSGVITGLFLGLRWVAGEVADGMTPTAKYLLYSPVLALAVLGPVQALSPWKLALPFHPVLIYGISALAWIAVFAALAAEKATSVRGWVLGIIVAACALPTGFFVPIWLLFQKDHALRGRISPTLSYEILSTQAWGGGRNFTYVIYRNPRAVPWVRRKAADGDTPCTPSDILSDPWRLEPGPGAHTVVISCDVFQQWRDRKVYSTEVPLR